MDELKTIIIEQLQQLQMLMHRMSFHDFMGEGSPYSPHRGQGRVLAILKMKPEISQRDLTYLLGMSKQAIAELLGKMEKSGYITREPSEDDKRVLNVKLTEEGAKAADGVDSSASEGTKLFDCLNGEELEVFSDCLSRIIKSYEDQFPEENFEKHRRTMEEFMTQYGRRYGFDGRGGRHGEHRADQSDGPRGGSIGEYHGGRRAARSGEKYQDQSEKHRRDYRGFGRGRRDIWKND